jgi:membrane peptidoglycan carboxypeptidase
LTVCEDAHFWEHRGFDARAIESSIRDNIKAGRFVRGASTISMQLAKNLYLGRQKTLSRKLQEAVLTVLIEQDLSKEEILELYLNIIEYGPGIFGIGAASEYYFRVPPDRLSLGQAFYLVSILPNPKQQHFEEGGILGESWAKHLRRLMQIAHDIHRITPDQLEEGLEEEVVFGVPYQVPSTPEATAGEGTPEAPRGSSLPTGFVPPP